MTVRDVNVLIVGAGPAGLGAAARLGTLGVRGVVVLDRERTAGGLPARCGHRGFGVRRYRWPLAGAEFARRLTVRAQEAGAEIALETTVLDLAPGREAVASGPTGTVRYRARALVLATGCREAPGPHRGLTGTRPAGVYTTGVVHRLIREHGLLPGREIVVAGSEDVGFMIVRQLSLLGARVRAVVESHPYPLGYQGNYLYSVWPFRVPVLLGHRIVGVEGRDRVAGVEIERLADGSRGAIPCDCLVLAGRFLPESALAREGGLAIDPLTEGPEIDESYQTSSAGLFACGNVLRGAESADVALAEGERTAGAVARLLGGALPAPAPFRVLPGAMVRSVLPQRAGPDGAPAWLMVRPTIPLLPARVVVRADGATIASIVRPWAAPHRSVTVRLGGRAVRGTGPLTVGLQGWPRAGRTPAD